MISIKKDFALAPTTLTTAERDTSIKQALIEKTRISLNRKYIEIAR